MKQRPKWKTGVSLKSNKEQEKRGDCKKKEIEETEAEYEEQQSESDYCKEEECNKYCK